ncbi:zinc-dependent metalloprotease [Emticicia sp. 21SJ11W-3]|nr:zinc-dependent metalloprotease [Emticicia sp. 21SJ11W-3]
MGVAIQNSMCTSNAYGMIANPLYDYQALAHELGHILGAGHVSATTPSTLMESSITGTTTFASASISEIRTNLTGGLESCLNTGEINVNKDGSPVNPYDTNYGCLYTWYSMNSSGPGVQSITWTVQNYSASGYVVTSNSSSATISAGSTAGDFVVKANKTNACGTIDRYYPFEVSSCFRLNVYPNPTTDILFIEFESPKEIKNLNDKLELFSENSSAPVISVILSELYAAKTISNNKIELDVKNLKRGTYYLVINNSQLKDKPKETIRILLE